MRTRNRTEEVVCQESIPHGRPALPGGPPSPRRRLGRARAAVPVRTRGAGDEVDRRVKAISAFAFDGVIVHEGEEREADDTLVRTHRGMFVAATDSALADNAAAAAAVSRRQAAAEAEGALRDRHAEATVEEEKAREDRAKDERRRRHAEDARREADAVKARELELRAEAHADIAAGRALKAT